MRSSTALSENSVSVSAPDASNVRTELKVAEGSAQATLTGVTAQLAKIDHLPVAGPVVRRALSVDPAQRFQDAAAFAAALAPHVAGCRAEAAALMQQLFGDELRAPLAG